MVELNGVIHHAAPDGSRKGSGGSAPETGLGWSGMEIAPCSCYSSRHFSQLPGSAVSPACHGSYGRPGGGGGWVPQVGVHRDSPARAASGGGRGKWRILLIRKLRTWEPEIWTKKEPAPPGRDWARPGARRAG